MKNEYQHSGKIDFIDQYQGITVCIIKGDDGLSYAAKKDDFPKSQRAKLWKGKQVYFNCEGGKKIAYEIVM